MLDAEPTPRARRHDANGERILDTALQLVADGGLEALSMARLAAAVDYTPGALYRYFDSKDALLSRLVARVLGEIDELLRQALARVPDRAAPLCRVFALAHGYRTFAARHPHRFALLTMTMAAPRVLLQDPADAGPVVARMMATLQLLATAIVDATTAKQLAPGDPALRTLCIFASLQGTLLLRKQARYAPEGLDQDTLANAALRALLIGWGATPASVDAALRRITRLGALPDSPGGSA